MGYDITLYLIIYCIQIKKYFLKKILNLNNGNSKGDNYN